MKEYKVEYTSIKKEYWCYVIEAENRSDAIDKVRKSGLDLTTAEDHEVASQIQWHAASNRPLLGWLKSIFK